MLKPLRLPAGGEAPSWGGLVPAVGAGLAASAAAVLQALLLGHVLDAAFLRGASLARLGPALAALAAAALARACLLWAQEVLAQHFSGRRRSAVRESLVRRQLALGPRFGWSERTGELIQTLVGGVDALDPYLAQYLPQAALAALVPPLVALVVLRADALSALVLLLTFPFVPLFTWLIAGRASERARRQWKALSRLSARYFDALAGLPTLRAFARAEDEAERLARAGERHRALTLDVLRVALLSALVLEALATLGTALVAVELGLRLLAGRVAFAAALSALLLAPEFYRPLRAFAAAFHAGLAGREAAARMAEWNAAPGPFAAPALLTAAGARAVAHGTARAGAPAVRFDAVGFAYDGDRPALGGLTFDVPAEATVALVGSTGAGKTTAAHLVLRFLEPQRGAITVDGQPLAAIPPETWRRRLAWVSQRPHLFSGTIRDNLLLARASASRDEIEHAAALAGLDAVLSELPLGLETPVGENGERLSGGEAQRLALARAFLKDAPLLVLDEPTAWLDTATEAAILSALARLRRGRTVLLIAHRLTTAATADRVVVMERGHVLEAGAPAALAAGRGPYSRLLAAAETP